MSIEAARAVQRPSATKRAVLSLLVGLMISVAVAWSAALTQSLKFLHATPVPVSPDGGDLWIVEYVGLGAVGWEWRVETGGLLFEGSWATPALPSNVPSWTKLRTRGANEANDPIVVLGFGWPWNCLTAELQTRRYVQSWADFNAGLPEPVPSEVFEVKGGWGVARTRPWPLEDPREDHFVLPYRPVAGGLLLNTVLVAFPIFLLTWAPAFIRHHRRRKPGVCVRCGYDLSGLGAETACPECGATSTRVVTSG